VFENGWDREGEIKRLVNSATINMLEKGLTKEVRKHKAPLFQSGRGKIETLTTDLPPMELNKEIDETREYRLTGKGRGSRKRGRRLHAGIFRTL